MLKTEQMHVHLPDDHMPKTWFNLAAVIPWKFPLPINGATGKTYGLEEMSRIYTKEASRIELLAGEYAHERFIKIPQKILALYRMYRPTPMFRAKNLEAYLDYPGRIYYKREDLNPTGSHKPNTSIPQAYYGYQHRGVETLVTDTGAGQWGAAVALSCNFFDLKSIIFMTRDSYMGKPYRVNLMQLAGARVYPSPGNVTDVGRKLYRKNPDHPGSLGIGMGEAMELVRSNRSYRLALGCMSYYASMHQTVIGLETKEQLAIAKARPDIMIACVGGGSNFIGFTAPFIADTLNGGNKIRFLAVESANVPSLTKGTYAYDYQDYFGYTPKVKMLTLGHAFVPPTLHSGGLRYHGKTPILSLLVTKGVVEPHAVKQEDAFEANKIFYKIEGVLAAPESGHAIAQTILVAREAKRAKRAPTIVFCLSGNGYLDLAGYAEMYNLHVPKQNGARISER